MKRRLETPPGAGSRDDSSIGYLPRHGPGSRSACLQPRNQCIASSFRTTPQRGATRNRPRLWPCLLQPLEVGEHVWPELLQQVGVDRVQREGLGVALGRPAVTLDLSVGGDGAAVLFDGRL